MFDENGIGRLVPIYVQLLLAERSPQHKLARHPDGSINTGAVPAINFFSEPQVGVGMAELLKVQLPNDPSVLSALTSEEIVAGLGDIYTKATGEDSYGVVCRMWCTELKLL